MIFFKSGLRPAGPPLQSFTLVHCTAYTRFYGLLWREKKRKKETITNIVKRTRYDLMHFIIIYYMCNVVAAVYVVYGVSSRAFTLFAYTYLCIITVVDVSSLAVNCTTYSFFLYTFQIFHRLRLGSFVVVLGNCARRKNLYFKYIHIQCILYIHCAVDLKTDIDVYNNILYLYNILFLL